MYTWTITNFLYSHDAKIQNKNKNVVAQGIDHIAHSSRDDQWPYDSLEGDA